MRWVRQTARCLVRDCSRRGYRAAPYLGVFSFRSIFIIQAHRGAQSAATTPLPIARRHFRQLQTTPLPIARRHFRQLQRHRSLPIARRHFPARPSASATRRRLRSSLGGVGRLFRQATPSARAAFDCCPSRDTRLPSTRTPARTPTSWPAAQRLATPCRTAAQWLIHGDTFSISALHLAIKVP
eukprot:SAG31_NODE_13177_length_887_cov_1.890863_1_plen_182_part_10